MFQKSWFKQFLKALPAYGLILALLFPFGFFVFQAFFLLEGSPLKALWNFVFVKVFFMTLFQAGLSTVLSLFFGLVGSLGLLSLSKKKYYVWIESLIILPALMPPLFLALSLVQILNQINFFPFGLHILIFAQVLTYIGITSVAFARILLTQAGSLSEWAYLHKVSGFSFFKVLTETVLLKDIKWLFVLVFSSIWTSLSLPLLLGGSSFFSMEFFIYEKLKDSDLWSQALSLILFQSGFIFLICWKVFSSRTALTKQISSKKIHLLERPVFLISPLLAVLISTIGLFFLSDLSALQKLLSIQDVIVQALFHSLLLSLGTGALVLLLLAGLCFSYQNKKARKFIASWQAPGASFVGFAFLMLPFYSQTAILLKWVLGLTLLLFPWIYRFRGESALEKMNLQVETARFLGAEESLIFKKILWPSNRSLFFLCAGIASFWACGNFSYSLIVSSGHWNLSLLVYDLFSSYHLDSALLLSWLLLIVSLLVFLFWTTWAKLLDPL